MTGSRHIINASAGNGGDLAMIGERAPASSDRLDLSGSISFFQRRIKLILGAMVAAALAGVLITLLADKTYSADAVVTLVNAPDTTAASAELGGKPSITSEMVDTQVEIITSRDMASRVATSLGLLKGMDEDAQRKTIEEMQRNVTAERNGESYAIAIHYDAPTGEEAAQRVNEFARQFTQWEVSAVRERNGEALGTIEKRLNNLRRQAQADTQALQRYRIANNLLSTSGASLTEQEISSYNQEVTRARAEVAEDQARLNTALAQLRSGSTGEDVGEALGSSVISSLRDEEAKVGGDVANFAARYGPAHPELVRAKGQLEEIRRQIQAEIGRVISNLQAKQKVSQQRLASLSQSLSNARGQLSQNNTAMVGLNELERKAEASQQIYETYLNSYKQLLAGEGSERPNARILTLADVPMLPSSPNLVLNVVLSVVIGLGLGILAAYIAEALFTGIASPEQIEDQIGVNFLGSIPLLASVSDSDNKEMASVQSDPRSAFAESFRSLRTSIEQAVHGPAQVIAITSALPNEGKTITASCLAQTLARAGYSTVLLDCDSRRRGVTRLLRAEESAFGMIEVLEGAASLDDALIQGEHGLAVLPMLKNKVEFDDLITDGAFSALIATLRERFDQIILDLPPVLPVAATRVLASRADATVMVARWRSTPASALQIALDRLPPDRINVVGVVLTQVDIRRRTFFGKNDPSFYYKEYREYYA